MHSMLIFAFEKIFDIFSFGAIINFNSKQQGLFSSQAVALGLKCISQRGCFNTCITAHWEHCRLKSQTLFVPLSVCCTRHLQAWTRLSSVMPVEQLSKTVFPQFLRARTKWLHVPTGKALLALWCSRWGIPPICSPGSLGLPGHFFICIFYFTFI